MSAIFLPTLRHSSEEQVSERSGTVAGDTLVLMGEKAKTVDEYLNALDPAYRAELERLRALVTQLVPDTEETISYGMPTLKYRNRALVYFTASKKHMSFYPSSWAIEELKDQLKDYKTTEHSIQFTLEKTLPSRLVADLVRVHVREIDSNRQ